MLQINHNSNGIFFGSGFLTFFCGGSVTTFNLKLESDITLLLWFTCSLRHLLVDVDCGLWKVSAVSTCNPRARLEQAGMLSFIYRIFSKETLNLKSKTGKQKSETSREPKLELKSENSRARARAASSNRFFLRHQSWVTLTPFLLSASSPPPLRLMIFHSFVCHSSTHRHITHRSTHEIWKMRDTEVSTLRFSLILNWLRKYLISLGISWNVSGVWKKIKTGRNGND